MKFEELYNNIMENCNPLYESSQQSNKKLILMRGISGSGKSTKASQLSKGGVVFSTDEFFYFEGKYIFDLDKTTEYHKKNVDRTEDAMQHSISPIVIDNNNITASAMKPYVELADKYGYDVSFAKPETAWAWDAEELAKRNRHEVPLERIQTMLATFEHDITVDDVRNSKPFKDEELE